MTQANILPMYEEVRRKIYYTYQEMKKQNSYVQSSINSSERKFRLIVFREKYLNFIYEVNTDKKLKSLDDNDREYLTSFIENIQLITPKDANIIVAKSSQLLENLGVTNIQYTKVNNLPLG
jgi:hypothetical protein